jgi:hypothetical protein
MRIVQAVRAGAVPLGHGWIQPIGLLFVLLFSKYVQILSKFKNMKQILFDRSLSVLLFKNMK